jgi:hypothetical protein
MNQDETEKKEKEIDFIFDTILKNIPMDVHIENIIIALNRIAAELMWNMDNIEEIDNEEKEKETIYFNSAKDIVH